MDAVKSSELLMVDSIRMSDLQRNSGNAGAVYLIDKLEHAL